MLSLSSAGAALPCPVASRIFEVVGGVDSGDLAADAGRAAMLKVREKAMTVAEAAATIFQQAATASSTSSRSPS